MKTLLPLILTLLVGCQSSPPLVTAPGPLPLAESAQRADARIPAVVGHYTLGAYVDPDNELIRHEAHAIQRLEAESRWDLRPITPLVATNPHLAVDPTAVAVAPDGPVIPDKPSEATKEQVAAQVQPSAPPQSLPVRSSLPEIAAIAPNADGVIDLSVVARDPAEEANPFAVRAPEEETNREIALAVGGLIHGVAPCALINGRSVEPGETIESLTVVRLEPDAVLFQHAGRYLRVPVADKPVRVRLPL
ncbi:hypothetical protein [Oleiharenicola sp. Vm1]|uniref:hypothetical protein n=1 Tax=Oleiharenicola sp. Vm1 TaxID=3398393 RepID=UPI0039F62A9A